MTKTFDLKFYKIVSQFASVTIAQYIDPDVTETDLLSTGFFNEVANQLAKGSVIIANLKNGALFLTVDSITNNVVTVSKLFVKSTPENASINAYSLAPDIVTLTPVTTMQQGDIGGTIVYTVNGTTFAEAIDVQNPDNWVIYAGNTGLELDQIVYVDENTTRFVFNGTVSAGSLSVTPKIAALACEEANISPAIYVIE